MVSAYREKRGNAEWQNEVKMRLNAISCLSESQQALAAYSAAVKQ
jgi:hypothetical protein